MTALREPARPRINVNPESDLIAFGAPDPADLGLRNAAALRPMARGVVLRAPGLHLTRFIDINQYIYMDNISIWND